MNVDRLIQLLVFLVVVILVVWAVTTLVGG